MASATNEGPTPAKKQRTEPPTDTSTVNSSDDVAVIASTSRSRNAGKLQRMMSLPLDILAEVTKELKPLDIQHLSRVSKHFRELFHPIRNRQAWAQARRNITHLPDCPPELNEAQYVALAFEHHCLLCGAKRGKIEEHIFRLRCCQKCHTSRFAKASAILRGMGYNHQSTPLGVYRVVPRCGGPRSYPSVASDKYPVEEFKEVAGKFLALTDRESGDPEAAAAFLKEKEDLVAERSKFAQEMQDWKATLVKDQRDTGKQRTLDIKRRLREEEGWTDQDFDAVQYLYTYSNACNQPRPLTDRIWNRLRTELNDLLTTHRAGLRRSEFAPIFISLVEGHISTPRFPFFPSAFEFARLPVVKTFLEGNQGRNTVTADRVSAIMAQIMADPELGAISESVKLQLLFELDKITPTAASASTAASGSTVPTVPFPTKDDLAQRGTKFRQARFFFRCSQSGASTSACQKLVSIKHYTSHTWKHFDPTTHRVHSPCRPLKADSSACSYAVEVLKAIGLPEDASLEDVKPFKARLRCRCGHSDFVGGKGVGFSEMVDHLAKEQAFDARISKRSRFNRSEYTFKHSHPLADVGNMISVYDEPRPEGSSEDDSDEEDEELPDEEFDEPYWCVPCFKITNNMDGAKFESTGEADYHLRTRHDLEDTFYLDDYMMPYPDLHCMYDSEDEDEDGYFDSDDEMNEWEMLAMMLLQSMY